MKDKHFRIPEDQAKDFQVLCALLGIPERQAGQLAMREWVRKSRSQVSLESWTEARGSTAPVNRALIKIQLTVVKADSGKFWTPSELSTLSIDLRLFTSHRSSSPQRKRSRRKPATKIFMKQSWQSQPKSRTPKQPQADDFGLRVCQFQDCDIGVMKKDQ